MGISYSSVWFISLAGYYVLLAIMRFMLLRSGKKKTSITPMESEYQRYRICGLILLLMNQALAVIVIIMVKQNRGFNYPGLMIYFMAAYSFYMVILAIVNIIRYKKHGSPILSAAKVISLVAALVSILSLETAMIDRFGGADDYSYRRLMTGITGGGVCIIVIVVAIIMIAKSTVELKKVRGKE